MLSIIIISKQEEKELPKLLESIKQQKPIPEELEIILSDAQSTDKTREIGKSYNCKIVEGGLPSVGRNNGAREAKGDLLLFLDADITLPKDFLKSTVSEFRKKNLSLGTVKYIPMSTKFIDKFLLWLYNGFAKLIQYVDPHAAGICIFCTKDIFSKTNGFDEKLLLGEDYEFCRRAGKLGKFRILNSSFLNYNLRRFANDGRFTFVAKCFKGFFYRLFVGEQYSPQFNYILQGGVKITKHKKIP